LKEHRTMEDNIWRDRDEYLHYDLLLFTLIGVTYMEEGVTEFSAWSKAMLAEDDSGDLRPFLRVVYVNSKTLMAKLRELGGPNWGNVIGSEMDKALDELAAEL